MGGGGTTKFKSSGAAMRSQGDERRAIPVGGPPDAPRSDHFAGGHRQGERGHQGPAPATEQGRKQDGCEPHRPRGDAIITVNPSDLRKSLTPRAVAALAFIAVQNAHRCYPRRCDVSRFLNLPHKRQSERVVEELLWNRYVERTDRGLEVRIP